MKFQVMAGQGLGFGACAALLLAISGSAWAGDLPATVLSPPLAPLPTFAQTPAPVLSPWTGFHFGTEVFAVSQKGRKGMVGGGINFGYAREFDNKLVVGLEVGTGYAPAVFAAPNVRGFNYARTDVKVGYDMGRVMPYVTAGAVFAKPVTSGPAYMNAGDATNDLFNGTKDIKSAVRVGTGVDYAVTNNFTVGVNASVVTGGRALGAPAAW